MPRPDRAHYVLDPIPDTVRETNNESGEIIEWQALQVWVDPAHREAARAPELRRYMEHLAAALGWATIIRFSSRDGYVVFPPSLSGDGQWHEIEAPMSEEFGTISRLRAMGLEPPA
jgi:hypothetical protein